MALLSRLLLLLTSDNCRVATSSLLAPSNPLNPSSCHRPRLRS